MTHKKQFIVKPDEDTWRVWDALHKVWTDAARFAHRHAARRHADRLNHLAEGKGLTGY